VPEKLRKDQDDQLAKFEAEEKILEEAIARIRALQ
jgi:hypothetical protein